MITGPLFPFKILGGEGTMTKGEEQEQTMTAEQEIEVARLNIAKAVNRALDINIGDKQLSRLMILATTLERIR